MGTKTKFNDFLHLKQNSAKAKNILRVGWDALSDDEKDKWALATKEDYKELDKTGFYAFMEHFMEIFSRQNIDVSLSVAITGALTYDNKDNVSFTVT